MKKAIFISLLFRSIGAFASIAYANHSWGGYHWARTVNPFNLKFGDNVSTVWDGHLATASTDWSVSSVLNTTIVTGQSKGNCRPTKGRVEVCNKTYGDNGWLGLAQIWVSGSHITQGVAKMNDTYFNIAPYNTPAWRQFVICQEVGHTFGLNHQDVNFSNANLGTCMDYTNDPDGTLFGQLDNRHPNQHDYDMMTEIYAHINSPSSGGNPGKGKGSGKPAGVGANIDLNNPSAWGQAVKKDALGKNSLFERDLGNGQVLITHVIWVK